METTSLNDGIFLMLISMGTVFAFLIIQIGVMNITERILKLIGKYFPEEIKEINSQKSKTNNKDDEIAVAIACALRNVQKTN